MPIICIIGPDGVGKTTQARLLQKKFERDGTPHKYVWLRRNHKISLPLLAFARVIGLSRVKQLKNGGKIVYHDFNKLRPVAFLYQFTLFVDILLSLLVKVHIPLLLGKSVICDRFIYDTLVDLVVSTKNPELFDETIGRLFVTLIPNTKTIMLKAQMETLRNRKEDVKEDEELEMKIRLYDKMASKFNIPKVVSDKSKGVVHNEIMQIICLKG